MTYYTGITRLSSQRDDGRRTTTEEDSRRTTENLPRQIHYNTTNLDDYRWFGADTIRNSQGHAVAHRESNGIVGIPDPIRNQPASPSLQNARQTKGAETYYAANKQQGRRMTMDSAIGTDGYINRQEPPLERDLVGDQPNIRADSRDSSSQTDVINDYGEAPSPPALSPSPVPSPDNTPKMVDQSLGGGNDSFDSMEQDQRFSATSDPKIRRIPEKERLSRKNSNHIFGGNESNNNYGRTSDDYRWWGNQELEGAKQNMIKYDESNHIIPNMSRNTIQGAGNSIHVSHFSDSNIPSDYEWAYQDTYRTSKDDYPWHEKSIIAAHQPGHPERRVHRVSSSHHTLRAEGWYGTNHYRTTNRDSYRWLAEEDLTKSVGEQRNTRESNHSFCYDDEYEPRKKDGYTESLTYTTNRASWDKRHGKL